MAGLIVPPLEDAPYPTLGPRVCAWIEQHLVFGPGDLRGRPARLSDEQRGLIARMYEVYPPDHPEAGRRRFKRCALSLRKGVGKTELAAWIAACELHAQAPVRCVGWDPDGEPLGGGVTDPYIAMVAYTEEQTEDLAFAALRTVLAEGPLAGDFDVGLERIVRRDGSGRAVPLASAPDARDGARTTFQHFDESHRLTLPRLKAAHRTMLANIPKRKLADAWSLETTTAPVPGEGSVAEDTLEYARAVAEGRVQDARLFFFHRQASDLHDLTTDAGLRAAILEASGPTASWSDIESIVEQWRDPLADRSYLERVWLNRLVKASDQAFDALRWRELGEAGRTIPDGAEVTLGFDGSRYHDATAIVATEIATGFQQLVGLWECPFGRAEWEVPEAEVDAAMDDAFGRWKVWRAYCDPPYWETSVAEWAGRHGEKRVIRWPTFRATPMALAIRGFESAVAAGDLGHDGDARLARHVGNARRRYLPHRDPDGQRLWLIQKERPDSPHKMDAAMAAVLAWQARTDALALGVGQPPKPSIYETRGLLSV